MHVYQALPECFGVAMHIRAQAGLDTSRVELKNLIVSAQRKKIMIFFESSGYPVGYVSWASVNKFTLNMARVKSRMPQYDYEWDDGNIMLVSDIVFLQRWRYDGQVMWKAFFRKQRALAHFRNRNLKLYTRKNNKLVLTTIPTFSNK